MIVLTNIKTVKVETDYLLQKMVCFGLKVLLEEWKNMKKLLETIVFAFNNEQ